MRILNVLTVNKTESRDRYARCENVHKSKGAFVTRSSQIGGVFINDMQN